MACHIYYSSYCCVMTVAVYEMQLKDAAAQIILWKNLNAIMARHGVFAPKVKTLMGDSAKAN
jgi:hypothetical protein